jgi:hypothetical protein
MKITKTRLKQIIREEYSRILKESRYTEEPAGQAESNEVLQFIEDSLENGFGPNEISSELAQAFARPDLQFAFDSEDIEGWTMAEDIISAALI